MTYNWRADRRNVRWCRDLDGGALLDVGCYGIDFVNELAAGQARVHRASVESIVNGVDATSIVHLESPDGTVFSIDCSLERDWTCTVTIESEGSRRRYNDLFLPHLSESGPRSSNRTSYLYQLMDFRLRIVNRDREREMAELTAIRSRAKLLESAFGLMTADFQPTPQTPTVI